jgi:hypothetical protein
MTKWIKILFITSLVLVVIILGCSKWILKNAFGPKYRTVEIKVSESITLKCEETYNADLAAIFYDVDFTLKEENNKIFKLGRGSFNDEHWARNIHVNTFADWIILLVIENSYAKMLSVNKVSNQYKDTILSPHNLRYDDIWKLAYNEIPEWTYSGSSKVDSISNDRIYITYEYRIGNYPPFKFYTQMVEYKIDIASASLTTIKVFERHEIIVRTNNSDSNS